jgi:hypothetical protein
MAEVIGDSLSAGNEGSLCHTLTDPDMVDYYIDFDSYFDFDSYLLIDYNDSAGSETPDVHHSEPLLTGPSAPSVLFQPERTTLLEPIGSIDNRPQPRFASIEIWDPSRELKGVDAEKEYNKTTKRHILPPKAPRKRAQIDEANRKRARHGTTCVRCKLQKLKAC